MESATLARVLNITRHGFLICNTRPLRGLVDQRIRKKPRREPGTLMTGHKQSLLIPRVTGGHDVSVAPEELEPTSREPYSRTHGCDWPRGKRAPGCEAHRSRRTRSGRVPFCSRLKVIVVSSSRRPVSTK